MLWYLFQHAFVGTDNQVDVEIEAPIALVSHCTLRNYILRDKLFYVDVWLVFGFLNAMCLFFLNKVNIMKNSIIKWCFFTRK